MKVAMFNCAHDKPGTFDALRARLAPRLRGTMPAAGLIGACVITLVWWLVVARGLWFAYEWVSA